MTVMLSLFLAAVNGLGAFGIAGYKIEQSKLELGTTFFPASTHGGPECGDAIIREADSSGRLRIQPDAGLGIAQLSWRGDLNQDSFPDLILRFPESCGNWGECPFAVYAACAAERYRLLWGPEYAVTIEVGPVPHSSLGGWRLLFRTERDEGAPERVSSRRLRFDGEGYQAEDVGR